MNIQFVTCYDTSTSHKQRCTRSMPWKENCVNSTEKVSTACPQQRKLLHCKLLHPTAISKPFKTQIPLHLLLVDIIWQKACRRFENSKTHHVNVTQHWHHFWHTEATWRSFCAEQTMAWLVESVESRKSWKSTLAHLSSDMSSELCSNWRRLEDKTQAWGFYRIIQGSTFPEKQFGLRICRVWWLVAQQRAAFASRRGSRGTTERCLQRIGIGMGCLQHDAGVLSQAGEGVSGSQTAREFYSLTMWMCSVKKVSCLTIFWVIHNRVLLQRSKGSWPASRIFCTSILQLS